jgi:hypothetical protein
MASFVDFDEVRSSRLRRLTAVVDFGRVARGRLNSDSLLEREPGSAVLGVK